MAVQFSDLCAGTTGTNLTDHTSDSGHTYAYAPADTNGGTPKLSGLNTIRADDSGTTGNDGTIQTSYTHSTDDIPAIKVIWDVLSLQHYIGIAIDIGQNAGLFELYKVNPHADGSIYCDRNSGGFTTINPTGNGALALNGTSDGVVHGKTAGQQIEGYFTRESLTSPSRTQIQFYSPTHVLQAEWIDSSPLPATRRTGIYNNGGLSSDTTGYHITEWGVADDPADFYATLVPGVIAAGTIGSTRATLTSSSGATGTGTITYQWQLDDGGGYDDIVGETSVSLSGPITGLTPGTAYSVKRVATDDNGSADSNEVDFTTVAALDPGVITDVATGATVQQLGSSSGASLGGGGYTYQWQRKLGAGAYGNVSGATSTTLTNSGLTPGATYTFKRIATDSEGTSADSNEITVTMSAALAGGTITQGTLAYNSADIDSGGAATGGAGSMTYQLQRRLEGVGSFEDLTGLTGVNPAADTTVSPATSYDYRRKVTDGEGTIAYSNELTVDVPAAPGGTFSASPSTVPANHTGSLAIVLTGSGTDWDGSTVFSETGAGGLVIDSYVVNSATSATLTCHTTSSTGTSTVDDGTANDVDITVATATLSLSPTSISVDATESITATGTNTLWTQEVEAGLFTGSGSGVVSNINVVSDTSATFDFTADTAETVTIDDESTGATDDITVNPVATSVIKAYADNQVVSGTPVVVIQNTAGEYWNGATFEAYTAGNVASYAIAATLIVGTEYQAAYPAGIPDGIYDIALIDKQGADLADSDFAIPYILDRFTVTLKNGQEQGWGEGSLTSGQDAKLTALHTAATSTGVVIGDIDRAILYGTSVQTAESSATRTMTFSLDSVPKVRITYNKTTGARTLVEEL